jgi:nucleoid-associated protein YgaU
MKQNERLLVYAVTGFLAIILMVAVVFGPSGREVSAAKDGANAQGLDDILGQRAPGQRAPGQGNGQAADSGTPGSLSGLPSPGKATPEQPLVAADRSMLASDLVEQQLGPSRRDRFVRIVRARAGDSLESLVRRWCGARDPFLDEAKSLNEELVVLRVGQEVCVPWVDDEGVLAAIEAQKPRTLLAGPDAPALAGSPASGESPGLRESLGSLLSNNPAARPTFAEPGVRPASQPAASPAAVGSAASAVRAASTYTVKSGDSLWRIADRTYGRQNAARMVNEIREANPGLTDNLRVGQKITLPVDSGT